MTKIQQHKSICPFHTIVVTSPDSQSAEAALHGPLHSSSLPEIFKKGNNHDVHIYSTSDPYDSRMGSGGGTLAALDVADSNNCKRQEQPCCNIDDTTQNGSVLIVHAGGQSSRCPTQITLGKAWTSLPTANDTITNPTYILLESLSKVLANLPSGSVVVAASDVLLSLPMKEPIDFDLYYGGDHDNKVLGLAVPAPLETAQNHGVFVLDDIHNSGSSIGDHQSARRTVTVKSINAFLQKPSIQTMEDFPTRTCVFQNEKDEKRMAWIDTGVIIFLPKAAETLRSMMTQDLKICTRSGLESMYRYNMQKNQSDFQGSIDDFAKTKTIKVELYSHLLLAIPTKGTMDMDEERRLQRYLCDSMNQDLSTDLLSFIYNSFHKFELQVCIIPEGDFIHLGTTAELRNFLIDGTSSIDTGARITERVEHDRCRDFGNKIGLVQQSQVTLHDVSLQQRSVLLNSAIMNSTSDGSKFSIGTGTVMEHCQISGSVAIGTNCLVSGLRGKWNGYIKIQDNCVCQLIKLRSNWREILNVIADGDSDDSFVCVYHHINDSIKAHETCYNVPIDKLLLDTAMKPSDLWEENDKKRLLWNAKINPIITRTSDGCYDWSIFSWIDHMSQADIDINDNEHVSRSLHKWKKQCRISLSQLRSVADASHEFTYRSRCSAGIAYEKKLQQALLLRSNEELSINTERFNDISILSLLKALDNVIMDSIDNGFIDISSRAFMVVSKILNSSGGSCEEKKLLVENEFNIQEYLAILGDSKCDKIVTKNACKSILHHRDIFLAGKPNKNDLDVCALALEEVAFTLTRSCVSSGVRVSQTHIQLERERWFFANAPGRVDISGGWSDTPPISYEHGGAVSCLAVTVDGKKPLSAKCRITGGSGILLGVESRDIKTGELNYSEKVSVKTVQDLGDYNNPQASCALLKCALIVCGIVPIEILESHRQTDETNDLQSFIDKICRSNGVGLELVTTSLLPQGSGMGSSSILAGCAIASLCGCLGLSFNEDEEFNDGLIQAVLLLEQLLTTGGGWQDQVGGLYGGLKLGMSDINSIPMQVNVKQVDLCPDVISDLNERMVLMYTGQPRLAKNILRNVLRQWVSRKPLIVETVDKLVKEANESIEALKRGKIDELGKLISFYWKRKKIMAGSQSGVEPTIVKNIIYLLHRQKVIVGATLCGAGGGGFLFALTEKGKTALDVKQCIEQNEDAIGQTVGLISFYDCNFCLDGVSISTTTTADDLK
jgi:galactokinase/mevalonate kinase-like predicted kinase